MTVQTKQDNGTIFRSPTTNNTSSKTLSKRNSSRSLLHLTGLFGLVEFSFEGNRLPVNDNAASNRAMTTLAYLQSSKNDENPAPRSLPTGKTYQHRRDAARGLVSLITPRSSPSP
jgi:hypothetical protein